MTIMKRLFYILYYLRETDYKQITKYLRYASHHSCKSKISLMMDILYSLIKYNISIKDYFCFRFFELTGDERNKWAGTGFMYEYQLQMNPKNVRHLLEDKIQFLHHFQSFVKREFASLDQLEDNQLLAAKILANSSGRLVLKGSHGQIGAEVKVIYCKDYSPFTLRQLMIREKYDLVEEYVVQHPALMDLSPSGLNTVRVITQLHEGQIDILGARLRVSVNSHVDNMAAGNLAAPINIDTGVVYGPGVFSDITKGDIEIHPVTGKRIPGFIIPYWNEVSNLVNRAALNTLGNRSVGWDVAITKEGPELIEGNHNWCKHLWQLPVKQGLKKKLEKYL
jgi:hypothetical protein